MLPREKFKLWGVQSLSISDLLAVILSSGSKKSNVFQISKRVSLLIKENKYDFDDFNSLDGMGEVKSMKIVSCLELGRRLYSNTENKIVLNTSEKVYETLRYIGRYRQEHLVAIFLNARYEYLGKKTVGIGVVDSVQILPRDIILSSLDFNASYVAIAHNHPSGNLNPSQGDIDTTNRIMKALELVGITLLDHLIITKDQWRSIV